VTSCDPVKVALVGEYRIRGSIQTRCDTGREQRAALMGGHIIAACLSSPNSESLIVPCDAVGGVRFLKPEQNRKRMNGEGSFLA